MPAHILCHSVPRSDPVTMLAKNILVPVDLRVASLNTLKLALEQEAARSIQVVLMYPERLSTSITELLFYSPASLLSEKATAEFREALSILRARYESKLRQVHVHAYHGKNGAAMEGFLAARKIQAIYLPASYRLRVGAVVDPLPFLRKAGLPVVEVDWQDSGHSSETDGLTSFFNTSI